MNAFEILGGIAPAVFAVVFIPQVIKVFLSRKTTGLSAISYSVIFVGSTLYMFGGGVKEEHMIQLFVAEAIVSTSELIIIYYIFKNMMKIGAFYFLATWGSLLLAATIVFLSIEDLSLSPEGVMPITIVGGLSIGLAFMPQTVIGLITRDVKNVSIITVVALFTATSLLGTYQLGQGNSSDGLILTFERYLGAIIEYMAAAWSIPQLVLKLMDGKRIRKAQASNTFERNAVRSWVSKSEATIYQKAVIIEWMLSEEHIDKEKLDSIADRLGMNHTIVDRIIDEYSEKYL